MGNALRLEETAENRRWNSVRQDMNFYRSYCMLTGKPSKTVHSEIPEGIKKMTSPVHEKLVALKSKILMVGFEKPTSTSVIFLVEGGRPYVETSSIIETFEIAGLDLSLLEVTETNDYITLCLKDVLRVRVYKHAYNCMEDTFSSMRRYDSINCVETDHFVTSICALAEENKPTLSLITGIDTSIAYKLRSGQTLLTVGHEEIQRQQLERMEMSVDDLSEQQLSNIKDNIRHIHTPQGVPPLDPYTRHGAVPIEYRRMWSFVHCCRDMLPACQFASLCKEIMNTYFFLAEKAIEGYGKEQAS